MAATVYERDNRDGDSSNNVIKTIGLMDKTTTLHV